MKKTISLLLALVLCLSLCACGGNGGSGATETTQGESVAIPDNLQPFLQVMCGQWKLGGRKKSI